MGKSTRGPDQTRNIFLSWSGERSLYIAKFFRDWLPTVLHRARPWLSEIDIDKGTVGLDEIKKALSGTNIGIFFLTPENRDSSWISYEAGVLAEEVNDKSRICTYLLGGLQIQHLRGPLGMFQRTKPEKEDTRKLMHTINKAIGSDLIPEPHLDIIFDKFWPELELHLAGMPQAEELPKPLPSIDEMIAEILELTRAAANSRKQSAWMDQFASDLKDFMPPLVELLKNVKPNQLLPAPTPPPLPREPVAAFCVKLAGDDKVKRIEGTMGVETAAGQLVILIGNEMVGKFESVENWWKESPPPKDENKE